MALRLESPTHQITKFPCMNHDFLGAIKTYGVREGLQLVICRRLYTYRPASSSHVGQLT